MIQKCKLISIVAAIAIFCACSDAVAETEIQGKTSIDRPVSPKEMQKMLGRGFDVQWAEFTKKIDAYGVDEVIAVKSLGFQSVRIRTALPADDYLLGVLDSRISDCLDNGITPVLAYNALNYERNPNEETLEQSVEWWKTVAEHFKDVSHRLIFNLNIEWSDAAGKNQHAIDLFNEKVTSAIRKTNPTRIIVYSPAKLSDPNYLEKMTIPEEAGDYAMAEWHLYAAGPSKNPNSKKYWSTGTEEEKKAITDKIRKGVEWQKEHNIPTWVGAWMPGNYNKGNDFSVEEQCAFAGFMISSLESAGIPWAVNSLDKYYDVFNDCWYSEMMPLINVFSGKQ